MITISQYVYLTEIRLLVPTFPFVCFLAAFAFSQLQTWDRPAFRLSWVITVLVTLVLAVSLVTEAQTFLSSRPLAPLIGIESRKDYVQRRLGVYAEAMERTYHELAGQRRFFFLWEPRGYYAERGSLEDATLDNLAQLRVTYGQAEQAVAALEALGVSHLLVNNTGLQFLLGPTPRPPTLDHLSGQPEAGESLYPLAAADRRFLADLLELCQPTSNENSAYAIFALP
jgi:hypothetical protein